MSICTSSTSVSFGHPISQGPMLRYDNNKDQSWPFSQWPTAASVNYYLCEHWSLRRRCDIGTSSGPTVDSDSSPTVYQQQKPTSVTVVKHLSLHWSRGYCWPTEKLDDTDKGWVHQRSEFRVFLPMTHGILMVFFYRSAIYSNCDKSWRNVCVSAL